MDIYLSRVILMLYLFTRHNAIEVSVKLIDGQSPNEGKVMVRDIRTPSAIWKPLCARNFSVLEASVVCQQLGYNYSLKRPNVYKTKISDWISDDTDCHGNETNIGECFRGRHSCFYKEDYYAAVCCSKSSLFGEWNGSIFQSHCSDTWLGAQSRCERLSSSLTVISEEHTSVLREMTNNYFWSGKFFTPWIWSDGCVQFQKRTKTSFRDYHLEHNSPGVCFQRCGYKPGTTFVLSGTVCRCLNGSMDIQTVKPGYCQTTCPGSTNQYCGDNQQQYWDLYKIGNKEDEFHAITINPNDTRQCAGLKQLTGSTNKLQTLACDQMYDYICSDLTKGGKHKYIIFRSVVSLTAARQTCRNNTVSWKLAGSDIISGKINGDGNGLLVDIESSMIEIFLPEDKAYKASNNINPERCQSVAVGDDESIVTSKIADCKSERLLYTCTRSDDMKPTHQTVPVSKCVTSKLDDVVTLPTNQLTESHLNTVTEIKSWQIVIAVLVGLIGAVLMVIIAVCWQKRKNRLKRSNVATNRNTDDYYSSLNPISRDSGQYGVIIDHYDAPESVNQPLNVYEELCDQASHVDLELNVGERQEKVDSEKDETDAIVNGTVMRKESLKLKSSYATPMDTVREKPGVKRYDSNAFDPKYSFPYDSVDHLNKFAIDTIEERNTDSCEQKSVINDNLVNENPCYEDVMEGKKSDKHHAIVEKKTHKNDTIVEENTDTSDDSLEKNIDKYNNDSCEVKTTDTSDNSLTNNNDECNNDSSEVKTTDTSDNSLTNNNDKCNNDSCVVKTTDTADAIKEMKTDTNNTTLENNTCIHNPILSNNTNT